MAEMSIKELENAAMTEFKCFPLITGSAHKDKARARRRERVLRTTRQYNQVMQENPGLNREDAARLTVGGLKILIGIFFPWVSIAISVAYWLWDYQHSADSLQNAANAGQ